MKRTILLFISMTTLVLTSCNNQSINTNLCTDKCKAKNNSTDLSCKLTSAEMQKRKTTVLESLRKQIIDKKELPDGYAFKFNGSDKMLDELTEFIKTERECCDFFTFNLSVGGDKNEIWLQLTGAKEAKDFIKTELDL